MSDIVIAPFAFYTLITSSAAALRVISFVDYKLDRNEAVGLCSPYMRTPTKAGSKPAGAGALLRGLEQAPIDNNCLRRTSV